MPRAARNFWFVNVISRLFYLNLMILGSKNYVFRKKHASLIYEFLYPTAPARVQICTHDLTGRPVWVRIRTHLGKKINTGSSLFQYTTTRSVGSHIKCDASGQTDFPGLGHAPGIRAQCTHFLLVMLQCHLCWGTCSGYSFSRLKARVLSSVEIGTRRS